MTKLNRSRYKRFYKYYLLWTVLKCVAIITTQKSNNHDVMLIRKHMCMKIHKSIGLGTL